MKTVISASRRTDIPAFYLPWFMKAIRNGEVTIRNPVYRNLSIRVNLHPEKVAWIVFWSRNYASFLKNHSLFSDYELFFHFTIISHHPVLEKHNLQQRQTVKQMESLVKIYGPDRITWRYDPIVIWRDADQIHTNYKSENFKDLCEQFSRLGIKRCYFSIVTPYLKFRQRFKKKYPRSILLSGQEGGIEHILENMREMAGNNGISLFSCCNDALIGNNIYKGRCISGHWLNQLNNSARVSEAKHPTREDCGCTRSVDIGDYIMHPCHYGCIYCYANPVWE